MSAKRVSSGSALSRLFKSSKEKSGKTQVFLAGATGYLGGTVLARLLKHPSVNTFEITALVRNTEKAKTLESKFGVHAVVGSNEDLEKVEQLAENADIFINIADADTSAFIKAILRGLKTKHAKTGIAPILIHTTGTAFITDDVRGEATTETFYDDANLLQLMSVPPQALHRNVDLLILEADTLGYVNAHLVCPATIYGRPEHALAQAGLTNMHSIQIPAVIKSSLARGRAGMVGSGKPIWAGSHVEDVAALYPLIFDAVRRDHDLPHGWKGFYYVANDEYTWADLANEIGKAMFAIGRASVPEPSSYTIEELRMYFGSETFGFLFGTNCRVRTSHATALGWKATHTTKDLLASIRPEVESLAA